MADLQIKLVLGKLDLFLQGESELVYKVFCDIRDNGLGMLSELSPSEGGNDISSDMENSDDYLENIPPDGQASSSTKNIHKTKSKKKNGPSNFQLLKDLNLNGKDNIKGLKDFVAEKNPTNNVQKTTVFVYYLQTLLNIEEITIDHIFTCYKVMNYRVPNNLQQNLTDTSSSRYGYIGRKDGKYSMTVIGNNFVEHDLSKGVIRE